MRQPKINVGNAADVIQRGRNVTIIPEETSSSFAQTERRRRAVRYNALDVVNGGPAGNPDGLSVNDTWFPGWRIQKYSCAGGGIGTCPTILGLNEYVEIINGLGPYWLDAWLNVTITHAASDPSEYAFMVVDAVIAESPPPGDLLRNVSYSYSSGTVATATGVYTLHLATTTRDRVRRMLWQLDEEGSYPLYFDEDYIKRGGSFAHYPGVIYYPGFILNLEPAMGDMDKLCDHAINPGAFIYTFELVA